MTPGDRDRPTALRALLILALLGELIACGSVGDAAPIASATASPIGTPTPTQAPPTGAGQTPSTRSTASSPAATAATCSNAGVLATWSVTRLAEQTVVVPVDENAIASVHSEVAGGAGGVVLFGGSAPANFAAQMRSLAASAPNPAAPFVMVDEEGGDVQRMANLVGSLPAARVMGATMTPIQIGRLAAEVARRMRAVGVTMDLAPVLDVDGGQGPNDRDADGTRSFSADPTIAAADGLAFVAGLRAGGIVPVAKHFPGLGGATANTDVSPASTPPWSTLSRIGLVPFEDAVGADAPAVMVANASVPGLTTLPASISAGVITGLLRDQLGFHGLVLTDSLSATALSALGYSVAEAAAAAIEAGADMVLFTATAATVALRMNETVSALISAVDAGRLDRSRLVSAVSHILTVKGVDLCPLTAAR